MSATFSASVARDSLSTSGRRSIGPIGTAGRLLLGLIVFYLALVDGPPFADGFDWALTWYDAALGALVLPGIGIAVGLLARHLGRAQIKVIGPEGVALNCIGIVALVANPYTAGGALLFYGASMLIAAARGQAGCEATVISNWILRRDDQIGCPMFTPIDAAEAAARNRPRTASSR